MSLYVEFCDEFSLVYQYFYDIILKIAKEVLENLNFVGKLNNSMLGKYATRIITEKVIITDERMKHIKEHHPELGFKEIKSIKSVIENPDYIFEDRKNIDTILLIKRFKISNKNYRMVVKLNTSINIQDKFNSIISFWQIGEKKLGQYLRNEKIIYEKLDK